MIYVEARSAQQVNQACKGLVGIYPSRGIVLVPIEEMASLLQIKKQDLTVTPGSWVRIKRGSIRVIWHKDDASADGRKRKKAAYRDFKLTALHNDFSTTKEVVKVYGRKQVSKRNQAGKRESNPGLRSHDSLVDKMVQRTKPLSTFRLLQRPREKQPIAVLQPGDHVEDVVTITAIGVDIDGQKVDVPARSDRTQTETGLVVSVSDNVVTFVSDMTMQEVSVFSKDLREAAEVGTGTNIVGNYELHDLVQLDLQTVGVIFKTERDSFRVLDQNGQVRLVQPHQISMRRDSLRAIATDSEGHELRVNDNVREIEGENRKGRVLHIYQSFFAFLHNRDVPENGGVFVTRCRSLASLAPKGNVLKPGTDLTKMNPHVAGGATTGGMIGSAMTRGPRDRDIGATVAIVQGPQKGYIAIQSELGQLRHSQGLLLVRLTHTAQASGGRTPGWGGGRTPNPYATGDCDGGKTPAWNAASRTPNPYADGGKTPAWNASSRTPNPTPRPGWGGGGWDTGDAGWGNASPARPAETETWTAPTPAAAPTPGFLPAQTPGVWNSAPTPLPTGIVGLERQSVGVHSAPTPAVLGADEDDTAPTWLLDPVIRNKNVIMEIVGTLGGWRGGELDGVQGYVTTVFQSANDTLVTLNYLDPGRVGTNVQVPISYLSPVNAKEVGDHAVPLDGTLKGIEVILRNQVSDGVWEVSKPSDFTSDRYLEEKLVKIHVTS
ncbi:hypothetical protein EDD16DRAFT_1720366 [Pisolithus croceorrhizus]|nr:hypothetical protein EDD16DRAFT_1720366 [Pisolithus croceorrhizus]